MQYLEKMRQLVIFIERSLEEKVNYPDRTNYFLNSKIFLNTVLTL